MQLDSSVQASVLFDQRRTEYLHVLFPNLTETVVTAHKENAKTVVDG